MKSGNIPHFQEHLEEVMEDFLGADHADEIFCQISILQSSHKSVPPVTFPIRRMSIEIIIQNQIINYEYSIKYFTFML